MRDRGPDPELVVEQIDLCFRILEDMERFLAERGVSSATGGAPDRAERIVVAHILENSYTAIETALLRISQGFGNSLSPERWHANLLDKMLLEKRGVRPRVLSEESHRLLTELMRFRHFKRYYLEPGSSEERDVRTPLSERRKLYDSDLDSIVEILAESFRRDLLAQVAIGRRECVPWIFKGPMLEKQNNLLRLIDLSIVSDYNYSL